MSKEREIVESIVELLKSVKVEQADKGLIVDNYLIYQTDDNVWIAEIYNQPACIRLPKLRFQNRSFYFLLQDVFQQITEDAVMMGEVEATYGD